MFLGRERPFCSTKISIMEGERPQGMAVFFLCTIKHRGFYAPMPKKMKNGNESSLFAFVNAVTVEISTIIAIRSRGSIFAVERFYFGL